MSKPSPSQNASVGTTWAPGIIRASVVLPAPPWPPIPTRTRPPPRLRPRSARARLASTAARYPPAWRSCGSAAWRSRTACSSTARPSWGAAVRAADGCDPRRLRHEAALRGRTCRTPFVQRPAPPRGGVRAPPRRAAGPARGALPVRAAARRVAVVAGAAAAGVARRVGARLSPAREAVAAVASLAPAAIALRGRRARRLPRRRAHLDRQLRARASRAHEGARALRLAPDRPAARSRPPRRARSRPRAPAPRPAARLARSALGAVGAVVEVFAWMGRQPAPSARPRARAARARAPAPRLDRRALARSSSRSRRRLSPRASRLESGQRWPSSTSRDERLPT